MPKSSSKRKNGTTKKYVQRDYAGNPVRARDKKHHRTVQIRQMMRMQLLNTACESLTSTEVQMAIDAGKGHAMSYVSTELDENGVPTSGVTKTISLASVDIQRLQSIHTRKVSSEEEMKKNVAEQPDKV